MFMVKAWSHHTHTSPCAEDRWCPVHFLEGQSLVGGENGASVSLSDTSSNDVLLGKSDAVCLRFSHRRVGISLLGPLLQLK